MQLKPEVYFSETEISGSRTTPPAPSSVLAVKPKRDGENSSKQQAL